MSESFPQKHRQPAEDGQGDSFLVKALPGIWAKRVFIMVFTAGITILATILIVLTPNRYIAETTILPESDRNKLLGMSGVADLAALSGLNVGDATVSRLYPVIIKSTRLLREVIYARYRTSAARDSLDLIQFWQIEDESEVRRFEAALARLRDNIELVSDNRLGTLTVKVELEEPQLAASVANRITSELDLFARTKRRTSATAQREFIKQRLEEVERALRSAEDALRMFREKNRRMSDSPLLMVEQGRLEREVQIGSTVFIELKKQIEVAKIEEIRNIPVINVLDEARVPIKKSSPNRRQTIFAAFLLGLSIAVVGVSLVYHPSSQVLVTRIRSMLSGRQRQERAKGNSELGS